MITLNHPYYIYPCDTLIITMWYSHKLKGVHKPEKVTLAAGAGDQGNRLRPANSRE